MLLPFTDGLVRTTHFDPEMAMLADRHYSRRTVGAAPILLLRTKLVLRDALGTVLFVWMFPDAQYTDGYADWLQLYNFRNESIRLVV